MHLSEINPYLYTYFKTNYFTGLLAGILLVLICFKYLPTNKLLIIVIAGVLLRLAWLLICRYRPALDWSDTSYTFTEYDSINIYAKAITKGIWFINRHGLPVAQRPIGYPIFLSLFYFVFGPKAWVLYTVNLALVAATIILIYHLGVYTFGERTGIVAAFLFAFYPLSIYSVSLPLDEHLFLPLWYFGLYLLLREIHGKRLRWAPFVYGLIFGYATMTRTHSIFMPLIVGFVYFRLRYSWKKVIFSAVTVYMISLLLIIPWAVRNYRLWGIYIPYTMSWSDIYSDANGSIKQGDNNGNWPNPGDKAYAPDWGVAWNQRHIADMERIAKREAIQWILNNPKDFFILGIEKELHFMAPIRSRGLWPIDLIWESTKLKPDMQLSLPVIIIALELGFGAYYILLYSFLIGILWVMLRWKSMRSIQRTSLSVIGLCMFFYLGEHFIIYPEIKYRFPIEPLMMIVSAAFFTFLLFDFKIPLFKKTNLS